jgi:hypothetical protein
MGYSLRYGVCAAEMATRDANLINHSYQANVAHREQQTPQSSRSSEPTRSPICWASSMPPKRARLGRRLLAHRLPCRTLGKFGPTVERCLRQTTGTSDIDPSGIRRIRELLWAFQGLSRMIDPWPSPLGAKLAVTDSGGAAQCLNMIKHAFLQLRIPCPEAAVMPQ